MLALVLLLACQGDPAAAPDDPVWSYEPTSSREASATPADIEAAVERWLPVLRTVRAEPAFAAFNEVTTYAEGLCPAVEAYPGEEGEGSVVWYADGCETSAGASFQGYAEHNADAGVDENGWDVRSAYIYGVAAVTTPAGEHFTINGYVSVYAGQLAHPDEEPPYVEQYEGHTAAADLTWDGPSADGTWLAAPVQITGGWAAYWVAGFGGQLTLDGTLSGDLGGMTALSATGLSMVTPSWRACPGAEPAGTVSLRDAAGGWYDVRFHGSAEGEATPEGCDGCGELWFEGEQLGEVCPDLDALLADFGP